MITNFVESFRDLLSVNDGNIEFFFKDTYSANDSRAAAQRILVSNNVNQGLKSMYDEEEQG